MSDFAKVLEQTEAAVDKVGAAFIAAGEEFSRDLQAMSDELEKMNPAELSAYTAFLTTHVAQVSASLEKVFKS